jgi:cytochrome c oxidase cbb3-type subunit III
MQNASIYEPLAIILVIIMLFLLLVIGLLANVLLGSASWYRQKEKDEAEKNKNTGANKAAIVTMLIALLFSVSPSQAQDEKEAIQVVTQIGGLSPTAFYFMVAVIAVELLVIFVLLLQLRVLVVKRKLRLQAEPQPVKVKKIWSKLNKFRPVEQEAQIDLGHEYDGIRELDNRLPPWWLYGFYITIIFAVVYLWRYHVSETAPLSGEEYAIAMRYAEEQKTAYLKKSANNVDENTVTLLKDAEALTGGKKSYDQFCSPCHGSSGEGSVGPNLTDNYWLHGGTLSDVFKSVKYGWPEKGMRSWKDDLSPSQIAQVTSYIKSLQGTNPANAKEKQGELYQETAAPESNKPDSTKKMASVTKATN